MYTAHCTEKGNINDENQKKREKNRQTDKSKCIKSHYSKSWNPTSSALPDLIAFNKHQVMQRFNINTSFNDTWVKNIGKNDFQLYVTSTNFA